MAAQVALRRQQDQEEYMKAVQLTQNPPSIPSNNNNTMMPKISPEDGSTTMAASSPPTTMIPMSHSWNMHNTQDQPQQPIRGPLTPPISGTIHQNFLIFNVLKIRSF